MRPTLCKSLYLRGFSLRAFILRREEADYNHFGALPQLTIGGVIQFGLLSLAAVGTEEHHQCTSIVPTADRRLIHWGLFLTMSFFLNCQSVSSSHDDVSVVICFCCRDICPLLCGHSLPMIPLPYSSLLTAISWTTFCGRGVHDIHIRSASLLVLGPLVESPFRQTVANRCSMALGSAIVLDSLDR